MNERLILAGDIGGTKCNIALFRQPRDVSERPLVSVYSETYLSQGWADFDGIVRAFLSEATAAGKCRPGSVAIGCFGVAGPVVEQEVATSNLPWVLRSGDLARSFGIPRVVLINDLQSTGYGLGEISGEQLLVLNQGVKTEGNGALIAAGTGLGESVLIRSADRFTPVAGEGGHCDFAPRDELECELLLRLRRQWEHVSCERVVSGPGLYEIYSFLLAREGAAGEPRELRARIEAGDPGREISVAALKGESPLTVRALDLFVSLYGAEAGNLALKVLALGGVWVGGGIAPKIRPKMEDGTFLRGFTAKGRFEPLLQQIPVYLVLEPLTALYGAARYAALEASS